MGTHAGARVRESVDNLRWSVLLGTKLRSAGLMASSFKPCGIPPARVLSLLSPDACSCSIFSLEDSFEGKSIHVGFALFLPTKCHVSTQRQVEPRAKVEPAKESDVI